MKRGLRSKAADKILKSVLDELKHDEPNTSEDSNSFDVEKKQFADIAITAKNTDHTTTREIPAGISEETARQITKSATRTVRNNSNHEATIVGSNYGDENTEATQPASNATEIIKSDESTNTSLTSSVSYADKTQPMYRPYAPSAAEPSTKVSHGSSRASQRLSSASIAGHPELQLLQAENLKLAQSRILELEKELERLRQENELLYSAGEIGRKQNDELMEKLSMLERSRAETQDHANQEISIFRDSLYEKERELKKAKIKIQELETRLATDLKKIRVRERELENRLELSRMEKTTLLRSKDENILELKRKIDTLTMELDQHKSRTSDLSGKIDRGQDQMARTVRALRLALSNLEANPSDSENQGSNSPALPVVIKKAE